MGGDALSCPFGSWEKFESPKRSLADVTRTVLKQVKIERSTYADARLMF